jgi:hypothetical protein
MEALFAAAGRLVDGRRSRRGVHAEVHAEHGCAMTLRHDAPWLPHARRVIGLSSAAEQSALSE